MPDEPDTGETPVLQTDMRWFETPHFEGAMPVLDDVPAYRASPFDCFTSAMTRLLEKGARFITWSDKIAGNLDPRRLHVILQHDVDAGPKSMRRLLEWELAHGVRSTMMYHARCDTWYAWHIDAQDIALLKEAEARGWEIGYHNNSVGNLAFAADRLEEVLADFANYADAARRLFREDVAMLRRHFNVRIFSPHGGAAPNTRLRPPDDCSPLTWVHNSTPEKHLWRDIAGNFSDGGDYFKPGPLADFVAKIDQPGVYHLLLHPLKSGNYIGDADFGPRHSRPEYDGLEAKWKRMYSLKRQFCRQHRECF